MNKKAEEFNAEALKKEKILQEEEQVDKESQEATLRGLELEEIRQNVEPDIDMEYLVEKESQEQTLRGLELEEMRQMYEKSKEQEEEDGNGLANISLFSFDEDDIANVMPGTHHKNIYYKYFLTHIFTVFVNVKFKICLFRWIEHS